MSKYRKPDTQTSPDEEKVLSISGSALVNLFQAVQEKGARFRFQAKGFSMSPFIKSGDVVTVYPLTEYTPVVGDVVVFTNQRAGKLIVHRLVEERSDNYLVKGDNTPGMDSPVRKSDIRGCVRRVERNGNKILLGLGPEKYVIALMSRTGVLSPLLSWLRWFLRPIFRTQTR